MRLSSVQIRAFRTIAANRNPCMCVILETDAFRAISTYAERIELLRKSAQKDELALQQGGFSVSWRTQHPELYEAHIGFKGDSTVLEWRIDSDYRFFDAVPDPIFGYSLHKFDLATNKLLAAVSRKEPRDILDLIHLHDHGIPLAAVVWGAPAKDPGYTPEGLLSDLLRNAIYPQVEFDRVIGVAEIDARLISRTVKNLVAETSALIAEMPSEMEGLVLTDASGAVAWPQPGRLEAYATVQASRHSHWPSSSEIASSMIHR
jgi:hypothetical protein